MGDLRDICRQPARQCRIAAWAAAAFLHRFHPVDDEPSMPRNMRCNEW
jgi:hypothetical protein